MPNQELNAKVKSILLSEGERANLQAFQELCQSAPSETLEALVTLLGSAEQRLRKRAVQALLMFHENAHEQANQLANFLLHSHDPLVRIGCAMALMEVKNPLVDRAYIAAMADADKKVAQLACSQLSTRGGKEGKESLTKTLKHPDWNVRLEACKSLMVRRETADGVVAALEEMSKDPEAAVYDSGTHDIVESMRELAQIVPQMSWESDENPWFWGKLSTILEKAREIANAKAGNGDSGGTPD